VVSAAATRALLPLSTPPLPLVVVLAVLAVLASLLLSIVSPPMQGQRLHQWTPLHRRRLRRVTLRRRRLVWLRATATLWTPHRRLQVQVQRSRRRRVVTVIVCRAAAMVPALRWHQTSPSLLVMTPTSLPTPSQAAS
jgi:hypothetical protein